MTNKLMNTNISPNVKSNQLITPSNDLNFIVSINGGNTFSVPCEFPSVYTNIGNTLSVTFESGTTLQQTFWITNPGNCIEFRQGSGPTVNPIIFKITDCLAQGFTLGIMATDTNRNTYVCAIQLLQVPILTTTFGITVGNTAYNNVLCTTSTKIMAHLNDSVVIIAHPTGGTTYSYNWSVSPSYVEVIGPTYGTTLHFRIVAPAGSFAVSYTLTDVTSKTSISCQIVFQVKETLTIIGIGVLLDGQPFFYPSCCGTICIPQNSNIILTANGVIRNPIYQWFVCNAPILVGGTGQTYQPNTSTIGTVSYSFILGQSGATLNDPAGTLFCDITINILPPISAEINATINCSAAQTLACGETLNICQGDIISLTALPVSECNNSYTYQWMLDGTVIATTQSITVCNNIPDTYTYYLFISYCCNIAINTSCSVVMVVSPKVTIVPIRNNIAVPFSCDGITVDQCDKLYLLAKTGENVVWLHDNKIVSIVPLIEIKTKHVGKFTYSVQLVSEETSVMCSACAACSIVVNVLKRHGHHLKHHGHH